MNFRPTWLKPLLLILGLLGVSYLVLRRPTESVTVVDSDNSSEAPSGAAERTLDIVTLLPRDAIPAIDDPRFYSAAEADAEYAPDELVLGVSLNGDSRAYSTGLLSRHEIVNDTVGGQKIAVTW